MKVSDNSRNRALLQRTGNSGYNIDEGACVEVPVTADKDGIHVNGVYTLPPQISALVGYFRSLKI